MQPTREVPFFNYRYLFQSDEKELTAIFRDVCSRGAFIQQKELLDFEKNLAVFANVKHALGVANATDGLHLLLRACGIGPGDEVIFPSHTFVATAAAIHYAGATPVPADCCSDHLVDPQSIAAAISPRTRAIMPVHLNGRSCAMDQIETLANKHGLLIVEDAAQALGAKFKGRPVGSFGVGGAISFYPAKSLGCFGDGGAVISNQDSIISRLHLLRDHGRNSQGEVEYWGLNSRLDNLQAAILDFRLKSFAQVIKRRRALAALYQSLLADVAELLLPPAPTEQGEHFDTFQNYEIEAEGRDALRESLKAAGVGTLIQWGGKAVHQYAGLKFAQTLPATEKMFTRCLLLPMNMSLSDQDVCYVANAIRDFYGYALVQEPGASVVAAVANQ